MKEYYLSIFTNKDLDCRSRKIYGQRNLFYYKVSRNVEETLRIANQGRDLVLGVSSMVSSHSLPLLNYPTWHCFSVFEFYSKRDAYAAARSIRALSRRPAVLKDVEKEIRIIHSLREDDHYEVPIVWNGAENVRILPGFDVSFIERCIAARSKSLRYKYYENNDV